MLFPILTVFGWARLVRSSADLWEAKQTEKIMKRITGIMVVASTLVFSSSMAFAQATTNAPPASTPPAYGEVPGQLQAAFVGAQCDTGAGSGAFNVYGPGDNPAGTVIGLNTGRNNSAVCGNRQGNLP